MTVARSASAAAAPDHAKHSQLRHRLAGVVAVGSGGDEHRPIFWLLLNRTAIHADAMIEPDQRAICPARKLRRRYTWFAYALRSVSAVALCLRHLGPGGKDVQARTAS
jgi:hypothetical protein